jgi:ABC-type nitrate/sulfonate/bicarbonate transport system substrate-binding protein
MTKTHKACALALLSASILACVYPRVVLAQSSSNQLIVSAPGACICDAAFFVGDELGIFRKHGIEVKQIFMTGLKAVVEVDEGGVNVGGAAYHVIAAQRAKGTPLVALFNDFGEPTGARPADNVMAIIARPGSSVRAGYLDDLKGKRVGLNRGAVSHMYLVNALAAQGIGTQDVTIQSPFPQGLDDQVTLLETGAIDAASVLEPAALRLKGRLKEAVIVQRGGNYIEFHDMAIVTKHFLEMNQARLKRYISAYAEAAHYARTDTRETVQIVSKHFPDLDQSTVQMALTFVSFDPRISKLTEERAKSAFEFAMQIGTLKEIPNFREFVDLKLLNEVMREHPEYFDDLPPIPERLKF